MLLTLQYSICPDPEWSWKEVRRRLCAACDEFSSSIASLAPLMEFARGEDDYVPKIPPRYKQAMLQARRDLSVSVRPGYVYRQFPSRVLLLIVKPLDGHEDMSLGCSEFPTYYRPPLEEPAHWHCVLENPDEYRDSYIELQAFMARWKLKLCEENGLAIVQHAICNKFVDVGFTEDMQHGLVVLRSANKREVRFLSISDAKATDDTFRSSGFQDELMQLCGACRLAIPKWRGWNAIYRTNCMDYVRQGKASGAIASHTSACRILHYVSSLGFDVHVTDRTGFWFTEDFSELHAAICRIDRCRSYREVNCHRNEKGDVVATV